MTNPDADGIPQELTPASLGIAPPREPLSWHEPLSWPAPLTAQLSGVDDVLAVVAHPDDESFGLGAVLAALAATGRRVRVLCLTHGEASTLGETSELSTIRASELSCAANELHLTGTVLDDWPDGGLTEEDPRALAGRIAELAADADAVVVLDRTGVTGHADHQVASRLAVGVADELGLLTIEWGVPDAVVNALRAELGVELAGLAASEEGVVRIPVDRTRQWAAIGCHASQQPDNPMLARRLALTGPEEWLRLRPAGFDRRLARFVHKVGPLARPEAGDAERRQVLDRLVGLAAGPLPAASVPEKSPDDYGVTCLHDSPAGWTLTAVRTDARGCTPAHDHASWGAAATVAGTERNRRFTGECPNRLHLTDEQLAPAGGGYLFAEADIHQACDATGSATVSLHLLAARGPAARQRCHERGASR